MSPLFLLHIIRGSVGLSLRRAGPVYCWAGDHQRCHWLTPGHQRDVSRRVLNYDWLLSQYHNISLQHISLNIQPQLIDIKMRPFWHPSAGLFGTCFPLLQLLRQLLISDPFVSFSKTNNSSREHFNPQYFMIWYFNFFILDEILEQ